MKKVLLASAALVAMFAGSAMAADMPARAPVLKAPPPPALYNWTGFYLGINGGGAWGRSSHVTLAPASTTGNFNISGGLGGGTVGANWQTGSVVFGIEADVDGTDIRGSTPCPNPAFTCSTSNTWLATVRGRLGWAADRVLVFGTAGFADGDIKQRAAAGAVVNAGSSTRAGWAAGGGVEYAFSNQWSAKLEYLHAHLDSFNCGVVCTGLAGQTVAVKFDVNMIRAGINFKFDWGGPVVARY
jgi:outer membrane immunogenic protein